MAKKKGTPKTGGRKKGTPNKLTTDVRETILAALNQVGGIEYLATVARTHPQAFCALIGRVLPTQVAGDKDQPIKHVIEVAWASQPA